MPTDKSRSGGVLDHLRDLLARVDAGGLAAELERHTRKQLVEWAEQLGITGLQRLTKNVLAERVHEALARFGLGAGDDEPHGALPRKFELRQGPARPTPAHIPWSYGHDRVTAMPVDPERLYVYWEVTDEAIARARAGLEPGGSGAWLDLRVYDVTGRIFDGTNAHHYFDQGVGRHDRQWFFAIGRPTSAVIVEIGLRSHEGYFVRMARSGRADFPAREPAADGSVEWLTVSAAHGPVDAPQPGTSPAPSVPPPTDATPPPDARHESGVAWAWESGPYVYPIESPAYVAECGDGSAVVTRAAGHTRIVYGPWHVVIRGAEVWHERRVLSTWELSWSWTSDGWSTSTADDTRVAGASDARLGASERPARGASEWRLGGASEMQRAGASERRLGGASEWPASDAPLRRAAR